MRRKRSVYIAVAVIALVLFGLRVANSRRKAEYKDIPPVRSTHVVQRGSVVASVSASGVVEPLAMVDIKSNVGGQVVEIVVDEGDSVEAGQIIARIDSSDIVNQKEQLEAEIFAAEQRIVQASEALSLWNDQYPSTLKEAEAGLDQATANYKQAEANLGRNRSLFDKGFVSKAQLDVAEQQYEVSKAQLDSVRENLLIVKAGSSQKRIKDSELRQAEANAARTRASMKNLNIQLEYTSIIAPKNGVITKKFVEKGSIITAGKASFAGTGAGVVIAELSDMSEMFVKSSVDESDIGQIRTGQKTAIRIDAFPDVIFDGIVEEISPRATVEQNVTTIPVSVRIIDPPDGLKPGMNASCDFIVDSKDRAIKVPNSALDEIGRDAYVVVKKNGELKPVKVILGLSGMDESEIVEGLDEGTEIVNHKMPVDKMLEAGRKKRPKLIPMRF